MTTFNFIKKNFTLLVIALLVIIILLQRSCSGNGDQINKPEIIKIECLKFNSEVDFTYENGCRGINYRLNLDNLNLKI